MTVYQGKLFPIRGVADLGPIGEGVTGPHWLGVYDDEGLTIYAAKCWSDEHPYLLLNEAVCARLAQALELPIPGARVIPLDNQLWFGLEKKEPKAIYTAENLVACINSDQVPGVLVFDVLTCNQDRHEGNAVIHRFQQHPPALCMWIIDHSHALVGTNLSVSELVATKHDTRLFLKLPHHLEVLERRSQFGPFIERLEAIDTGFFVDIVASLPNEFIPSGANLQTLSGFLVARRDEVRYLLDAAFQHLPH